LIDQRAGNSHPLLLAARKLVGMVMFPAFQTQHFQSNKGLLLSFPGRHVIVKQGKLHIFQRGCSRQQIKSLKDKTDLAIADGGQFITRQAADFVPVQDIVTGCRLIETADDVHKRGLARSGGSHDGDKFSLFNAYRYILQGVNTLVADIVYFDKLFGFNQTHYINLGGGR